MGFVSSFSKELTDTPSTFVYLRVSHLTHCKIRRLKQRCCRIYTKTILLQSVSSELVLNYIQDRRFYLMRDVSALKSSASDLEMAFIDSPKINHHPLPSLSSLIVHVCSNTGSESTFLTAHDLRHLTDEPTLPSRSRTEMTTLPVVRNC